ncbi:2-(acetamidomethylene)succinate hydrolase (plasmid) [Pseudoseohaeicola sp. NH-UV-7]|uniref:alpha/beta fold hydrolase n=1 Tax=Sulfitobacter sp. TBRI5 TaxID=2989732 RepID=UPI003A749A9A
MATFQTADGLTLHYTDEGHGPAILCLSGLTRNASDFDYVTPHLHDARLIKLDYRGRGKSVWAKDWTTYTIPTEAGDVLALMDHLGLEKAAILGTSRGGLIAMGLAAGAHDRISGVALNDIGPELDPAGLTNIMGYLGRNPKWKTHAEAAAERPAYMKGFANVPPERWLEEVQKLYVAIPEGLKINYDPHLRDAVEAAGATPAPDLWPLFDALDGKPLCCIRGANSDLLSVDTLAEMVRRRPDMIVAEVPDRAHIPFLDEPEAVLALRTWLGELA